MNRSLVHVCAVLSLSAGLVRAQLLYHTDFETSAYVAGQSIDGRDGWVSLVSPDAPLIVNGRATASSGRHALSCWGGGPLEDIGGLLDGAWAQPVVFNAVTPPHRVRVQADIWLAGPGTGSGPANDLVSANLYARNGGGQSAFFFVSSTGEAYAFANGTAGSFAYQFATPVPAGRYSRFAITLDYAVHLAAFEVNGVVVGVLPFGGGANEGFRGVLLEFAALADPLVVDPALYTGWWDNISALAKPAR